MTRNKLFCITNKKHTFVIATSNITDKLDWSLPANPVNDRLVANAVMLKSTFRLLQN